jgi:hypothetical protein
MYKIEIRVVAIYDQHADSNINKGLRYCREELETPPALEAITNATVVNPSISADT